VLRDHEPEDGDAERVQRAPLVAGRGAPPPPCGGVRTGAWRAAVLPALLNRSEFPPLGVVNSVEQQAIVAESLLRRLPVETHVAEPVSVVGEARGQPVFPEPRIVEQVEVEFVPLARPWEPAGGDDLPHLGDRGVAEARLAGEVKRGVHAGEVLCGAGVGAVDDPGEIPVMVHHPVAAEVVVAVVAQVAPRDLPLGVGREVLREVQVVENRIGGLVEARGWAAAAAMRFAHQAGLERAAEVEDVIEVEEALPGEPQGLRIARDAVPQHLRPQDRTGRPRGVFPVVPVRHRGLR